jgi:hypothetical protein
MTDLDIAASNLFYAHEAFLDAFEAAVLDVLSTRDRRAVEGATSEGEEGPDRLPLLTELMAQGIGAREAILSGEIQDARVLAAAAVKTAAAAISRKINEGSNVIVFVPKRSAAPERNTAATE